MDDALFTIVAKLGITWATWLSAPDQGTIFSGETLQENGDK